MKYEKRPGRLPIGERETHCQPDVSAASGPCTASWRSLALCLPSGSTHCLLRLTLRTGCGFRLEAELPGHPVPAVEAERDLPCVRFSCRGVVCGHRHSCRLGGNALHLQQLGGKPIVLHIRGAVPGAQSPCAILHLLLHFLTCRRMRLHSARLIRASTPI